MSSFALEHSCFETRKYNDISIVKVNIPEATYNRANEFKNCLEEVIKHGNFKLLIDFTDCRFIDSTFLGALTIVLKALKSVDGKIKLVYDEPIIRAIFDANGIRRVIPTFNSFDEALESFDK